jgi:hypothetical protein
MGLFNFFKKKEEQPADESRQQFADDMAKMANSVVERFKGKYDNLDFSVDSLTIIDKLLEEASDFYEEMGETQQKNLVETVGAYIFEVAKRNYGGTYFWYDHLNQPILVTGEPIFKMSLLAFEKVKGRLKNGYEDNIPFFFAGYTEGVEKKMSAMIV